jgi:hypothetical protein
MRSTIEATSERACPMLMPGFNLAINVRKLSSRWPIPRW